MGATTLMPACSVDSRQLSTERMTADMGGAGSAGSGGCATAELCDSTDAGEGGDSGVVSDDSGAVLPCSTGLCPDLNGNNVLDNTENLAQNPTFDSNIGDWDTETGIGLGWNASDACGRCDSGSISVTNQFAGTSGQIAVGGAWQCLEGLQVTPNRTYTIMGRAKPAADTFGGFGLEFFASADCSGKELASITSHFVVTADSVWHSESISWVAPDSAQSVALRLLVAAPALLPAGSYANVLFDNILVLAQ